MTSGTATLYWMVGLALPTAQPSLLLSTMASDPFCCSGSMELARVDQLPDPERKQ